MAYEELQAVPSIANHERKFRASPGRTRRTQRKVNSTIGAHMSKNMTPVLAIGTDAIRAYDDLMKSVALSTPEYERFERKHFEPESVTPFRDLWSKAIAAKNNGNNAVSEESK